MCIRDSARGSERRRKSHDNFTKLQVVESSLPRERLKRRVLAVRVATRCPPLARPHVRGGGRGRGDDRRESGASLLRARRPPFASFARPRTRHLNSSQPHPSLDAPPQRRRRPPRSGSSSSAALTSRGPRSEARSRVRSSTASCTQTCRPGGTATIAATRYLASRVCRRRKPRRRRRGTRRRSRGRGRRRWKTRARR